MIHQTNHVIDRAEFTLRGAPNPEAFDKSGPGYYITLIKRLDEGLRYQILGKKIYFTWVIYLSCWAKIELRRHGSPSCQYCCRITVVRLHCTQTMLKESKKQ